MRYDAEKRLLKQGKDASMKRPADVAPDQRTRNSLMSLWEACEDGKLEITRKMLLVRNHFCGSLFVGSLFMWITFHVDHFLLATNF